MSRFRETQGRGTIFPSFFIPEEEWAGQRGKRKIEKGKTE